MTLDHTYNRAGMRLTEAQDIDTTTATDGTATFTYDKVGRITNFDTPIGGTANDQVYGWQKVPNRDSLTIGTGSPVTTTFDNADRITSSGFSHDADGRMTARPGQQLVWDSLGRLTTVKTTGGTTISAYTYDALDRLRQVTRSGTTLRFRYVGMTTQLLQVYNVTTSSSVRRYAWDRMGTMLAHFTGLNSGIAHHGTNGHRDITWTADSTGAITRTARYDPWGGLLASSGSTMVDFRYQGSWYDTDTDLHWVVTRWYAPTLGRFVSEDTLLGTPTNPMSRHLYAYAEGDPMGGWDPDGRTSVSFDSRNWRRSDKTNVNGVGSCNHVRSTGPDYLDITATTFGLGLAYCQWLMTSQRLRLSDTRGTIQVKLKGAFTWWLTADGSVAGAGTMAISIKVRILEDGVSISERLYGRESRDCKIPAGTAVQCHEGDMPGRVEETGFLSPSKSLETYVVPKAGRRYRIQVVAAALALAGGGLETIARITAADMTAEYWTVH